jgi:hypothetical protein
VKLFLGVSPRLLIRPYEVLTPVRLEPVERLVCFDLLSTKVQTLKDRINNEETISALNHLIQVSKDGEREFHDCAEKVTDPELLNFFY